MRFKLLVAALLATLLAAPLGATDRPVGPETGQARSNAPDQVSSPGGLDDGGIDAINDFCRVVWWSRCEVRFYDWRVWGRTGGGGRPGGPR